MAWPTTSDPRTEFITVRFTQQEADDIDRLVQTTGARSRSAAVRKAVDDQVSRLAPATPVQTPATPAKKSRRK